MSVDVEVWPLRTQLDSGAPTEGDDCGVLGVINAVIWASHNKVGPPHHGEDLADWVRLVRKWAGRPRGPMLIRGDVMQALAHPELRARFKREGARPFHADYSWGLTWDDLRTRLKARRLALLAVDYGTLHDGNAPIGSASFRGGHVIDLLGATNNRGRIHTLDGDPLFDGRRKGIPDGWTEARLVDFQRAAGDFGSPRAVGYGRTCVITIDRDEAHWAFTY